MKSLNQAVLTESSIVVLSNGVFQTSIPLRHWSTNDGVSWSGRLRQAHQIEWLIVKLNDALNDPTEESIMQRVLRVLADSGMPPRVPPRPKKNLAATEEAPAKKRRRHRLPETHSVSARPYHDAVNSRGTHVTTLPDQACRIDCAHPHRPPVDSEIALSVGLTP
jgi:hypothetical protein